MGVLYLLFTLLVILLPVSILAADCFTVPIALDSFKLCQNDKCYLDQQVLVDIPTITGTKSCIQFISPIGNSTSKTLDITVDSAYFSYIGDNSQYFDDPRTDAQGYCGCPGGHTVNCHSNSVHVNGPLASLCIDGTHKNNYCVATKLFGTPGTYVYEVGFDTRARFKAIKLLPAFTPFVNLVFEDNNGAWPETYNGQVISSTYNSDFNITIITDTMKDNLDIHYVVFDRQSKTDFWLLPADTVNDINQFDTNKLAWAKIGQTVNVDPNLLEKTSVVISDCKGNSFAQTTNWLNNAVWLNNNKNKLSATLAPHALLFDPDWIHPVSKEDPNLFVTPYEYIDNGWIYTSDQGGIKFVGFNEKNYPVPWTGIDSDTQDVRPWLVNKTHLTMYPLGTVNLADNLSPFIFTIGVPFALDSTFNARWISIYNKTLYEDAEESLQPLGCALCRVSTSNSSSFACGKWGLFGGHSWPSGQLVALTYDNGYFRENMEETQDGPSSLHIPSNNGVIQVAIHFKNFTVQFDQTLVKPVIDSVKQDNTTIVLKAHSSTVPGTCIVASSPVGLFITQGLNLEVNVKEYTLTSSYREFNQSITVIIRCHDKMVNSSLKVSFNLTEVQSLESGFNSSNPQPEDFINPGNWHLILTDPISSWKHKLYVILLYIGGGAAVIALTFVAFKVFRYRRSFKYSKLPKLTKRL